jgi:hypothetical protein
MTIGAQHDLQWFGAPGDDGSEWALTVAEAIDAADLIDVLDSVDRVIELGDMRSSFAAQQFVQIDAMHLERLADAERHGRALTDVIERSLRLELAAALRITEYAANELISVADALVHRYPAALESLNRARMTERHASILVDGLDSVEPELRVSLEARAIALAEAEPVGTFRRALRKLIDAARADTLAERHEEALRKRRVVVEAGEDGMAWVHAHLPAVEAHAIHDRVTRMSKVLAAVEGETRTLDQLRADVLCDLLIDGTTRIHPSEASGIRASVTVTVPALALLDSSEGSGAGGIAVVEGVGPIPIARARELCGGADGWMRVLTHPETGVVLSVGRDRYRPPPALRRLVRWRADRCMAPGCGMPASRCEIDHSIAWEHGGETSLHNLCPLCKGHHIVKHHGDWTVRHIEGGALEWTSPAGRRYVVQPERRVPVFRPVDEGNAPF